MLCWCELPVIILSRSQDSRNRLYIVKERRGTAGRGAASYGRDRWGMGLIADRGLEIVLLRVLNPAGCAKARRGMSWSGMVRFGEELVIVDRTFSQVSLRVLGRGIMR